jgi:hypothetical protein
MERDGDDCSLCRKQFPHNSKTFGGVTTGGKPALVGECCERKLKTVVLAGLYINRHTDVIPTREQPSPEAPLSAPQIGGAINALQNHVARVDKEVAAITRLGGLPTEALNVSLGEKAWKTDDAAWFEAHPTRSHRVRPLITGETTTLLAPLRAFKIPDGHEFQVLIRQVKPGVRLRMPFCKNNEIPVPDIEEVIHALFDIASKRQDANGVISVNEVAALALKYTEASDQR